MKKWTIEDSKELYNIGGWGTSYFGINDLSDFKVQAQVDEHYIDRVKPGLTATFDQNGKHYLLQVRPG